MAHRWRPQFGLRTLLLAMLVLGMLLPSVVQLYRQWRDEQAWQALDAAKQQRDQALIAWRRTYEATAGNRAPAAIQSESSARDRYYTARQQVEAAVTSLHARYDAQPGGLVQAAQRRSAQSRRAQPAP